MLVLNVHNGCRKNFFYQVSDILINLSFILPCLPYQYCKRRCLITSHACSLVLPLSSDASLIPWNMYQVQERILCHFTGCDVIRFKFWLYKWHWRQRFKFNTVTGCDVIRFKFWLCKWHWRQRFKFITDDLWRSRASSLRQIDNRVVLNLTLQGGGALTVILYS